MKDIPPCTTSCFIADEWYRFRLSPLQHENGKEIGESE